MSFVLQAAMLLVFVVGLALGLLLLVSVLRDLRR